MLLAGEILWFLDKQKEAIELQNEYGMAQSYFERSCIIQAQDNLINELTKHLKDKVTLHMMKKIIAKIIIKKL